MGLQAGSPGGEPETRLQAQAVDLGGDPRRKRRELRRVHWGGTKSVAGGRKSVLWVTPLGSGA